MPFTKEYWAKKKLADPGYSSHVAVRTGMPVAARKDEGKKKKHYEAKAEDKIFLLLTPSVALLKQYLKKAKAANEDNTAIEVLDKYGKTKVVLMASELDKKLGLEAAKNSR